MKKEYYLIIKLKEQYSSDSIYTILNKGTQLGFKYLDDDRKEITAQKATEHVITAEERNDIPGIFTLLNEQASDFLQYDLYTTVTLFFYQKPENNLQLHVGCWGSYINKDDMPDLGFYVPYFIQLCEGFTIIKIETDYYEDY